MRILSSLALLGGVLLPLPCPAPACSFCPGSIKDQPTLSQEWQQARMVLYGWMANPQLNPGGQGKGTTDFHIEGILKPDASLNGAKTLSLPRYIPVLDAKNPPRFLVFFNVVDGKLDDYLGKPVQSPAVLEYVAGAIPYLGKSRLDALQYYFRFIDHKDELIAHDAFLEFAKASDREVAEVSRALPAARVRALLQDPKNSSYRRSVYAFMLGHCGGGRDAQLLRSMLEKPNEDALAAYDGILAGYITLQPKEGWELAYSILSAVDKPFQQRHLTFCALRFLNTFKPEEYRAPVVRGLSLIVPDGDTADLAIEELRRNKIWDLTPLIVAQYGKPSHNAPIVRRCILRYALCCPAPEARKFIEQIRQRELPLIAELEEGLMLERPK